MITLDFVNGVIIENGETTPMPQAMIDAHAASVASSQEVASINAARELAKNSAFDLMLNATAAVREWCMDTQAWLYTAGAQGQFDEQAFLSLVQQVEAAGMAYNNLDPSLIDTRLIQEHQGMSLRGQQAQVLYGMAKAV